MLKQALPKLVVFDFDGVLTDNTVLVFDNGQEAVVCSRSDGLAFDMLRNARIPAIILSTERNVVVKRRATKLGVPAIQGVSDKASALQSFCKKKGVDLQSVLYVGNDLNDLEAMKIVGIRACPRDAHAKIRRICQIRLESDGGKGAVRELVEKKLGLGVFVSKKKKNE